MILTVRNTVTNEETNYKIHKAEDFDEIFDHYPRALDIALRSDSIQDAAEKIAKYIGAGSRVFAWVHSGVQKSEDVATNLDKDPEPTTLKLHDKEGFKTTFNLWAEKRAESKRGLPRDTSFAPDPGRIREDEPDQPMTQMDRLKARIEESNEDR